MVKVKFWCDTKREIIEVPNFTTVEQLDQEFKEWVEDNVDSGWEEIEDETTGH